MVVVVSPPREMLAKVHIARKQLAIDDGAYRSMLERLTGESSSAACTGPQLARVLDELKAKGFRPKVGAIPTSKSKSVPSAGRQDSAAARKARALWISLHQLGVVRDPSEAALRAFAKRQLKVEALEWADQAMLYKLIEALKAMAERAGWRQDTAGIDDAEGKAVVLKARLQALLDARRT